MNMESNNNKNVSLRGSIWLMVLLIAVAFIGTQKADAASPKDDKDVYPMDFMLGSDSAEGYLAFNPFALTAQPRTPSRAVRSQTPSRYATPGASASVAGTPSGVSVQTATAPIVTSVVTTEVLVPAPKVPSAIVYQAAPAPSVATAAPAKAVVKLPVVVAAVPKAAVPVPSVRRPVATTTVPRPVAVTPLPEAAVTPVLIPDEKAVVIAPSVAPVATPKVAIPAPIMAPVATPEERSPLATASGDDSRRNPIRIPYRPPLRSPYQLPSR